MCARVRECVQVFVRVYVYVRLCAIVSERQCVRVYSCVCMCVCASVVCLRHCVPA